MEIEVGEYVRTDKGYITKMSSEEFIKIMLENKSVFGKALKHSKNIIDLVEVGDYVNGYKVEQASIETNEVLLDHNGFGWRTLKDGDKIVTHEQFASMEYKVKVEG